MPLKSKMNNKSISLIELIITTAILSIGIIVILQAVSFSARMTALAADTAEALFITQDNMQEWEFKEKHQWISPELFSGSGQEGKYKWKYNIELDDENSLYRLNFMIDWQRMNRIDALKVQTYLR